jgi:hypothetical protein
VLSVALVLVAARVPSVPVTVKAALRRRPAGPRAGAKGLRRSPGGHFLTKSRLYSVTFRLLSDARVQYRRTVTVGPEVDQPAETPTVLVVNFLQFVGAGWHNAGDAVLANTAAAMARERQRVAREELTTAGAR